MNRFKGVIDTTLRDGQQSPLMFDSHKYRFNLEEKKTIINGLIKLGVTAFEFFAPNVSKIEHDDFIELKGYIRSLSGGTVKLYAHCRCHPTDISEAIEAGFDGLNLYIGVTEHAQTHSHGKSLDQILEFVTNTLRVTREKYPYLYLRFSAEDCFRTPLSDIYEVFDRVAPYVQTLGLPDTVGISTPKTVRQRIKALRRRYPTLDLECHFHNDRGYALVNSVTAVEAGASYIDTAVWGLAERSGITTITGLLFDLYYTNKKFTQGFNLSLCYPLNVLMGSILKLHVPYNEPVSLTNRTHTAGVHQKAVLNNAIVYEAYDLSMFGVNKNQLLLGPLSGWNLIYYYLREVENYDISPEDAKQITQEFKHRSVEMHSKYPPEKILHEVVTQHQMNQIPVPQEFSDLRLENLS